MAPLADHAVSLMNDLSKRATCAYTDRYGRCYSTWSYYGRWIFAAIVIVVIIAIFFLWACVKSRRRRRRGAQPMYGTGWMAGNNGHNPHHNNPHGYNNNPPPAYGAPQGQSYPMNNYQPNNGYYGQESGVQQPKNVYPHQSNGAGDYAPPAGPPPGK
ncbi:chitin synthesis regulation, resistance to congo red-domain-containing protein [Xylariaceae sp. FL0016]|nr:chitin synthesis regulation, resistance to congo red-domain-containing protein [Xylariaceae sp. FL0016]